MAEPAHARDVAGPAPDERRAGPASRSGGTDPLAGVRPAGNAAVSRLMADVTSVAVDPHGTSRASDGSITIARGATPDHVVHESVHARQRARGRVPARGPAGLLAAEIEAQQLSAAFARTGATPTPTMRPDASETLRYDSADALLRDLRRDVDVGAQPDGLLGRDVFGVREAGPAPAFLPDGHDAGALQPEQLVDFFARLSLTRDAAPQAAELTPGAVAADARGVTVSAGGDTKIPHLVHSIWLGGPLMDADFRNNVAAASAAHPDWQFMVWNDTPRSVFEEVRRLDEAPAPGSLHERATSFLAWATAHRVQIMSVDEVFSGDHAMDLQAEFRSEQAKETGVGYAGASDLLRIEILKRFGGVYCDGDNLIGPELDAAVQTVADSADGLGVADMNSRLNNSGFVSAAGHGFWDDLQATIRANYAKDQSTLLNQDMKRALRREIMARTGPGGALKEALTAWGGTPVPLADDALHVESAATWTSPAALKPAPGDATVADGHGGTAFARESLVAATAALPGADPAAAASPPAADDAAVLHHVKLAYSTLLRELENRDGELYLPLVERALNLSGQKELAWVAMARLLAASPEAARVTSLTVEAVDLPLEALTTLTNTAHFPGLVVDLHSAAAFGNQRFVQFCVSRGLTGEADIASGNTTPIDYIKAADPDGETLSKRGWSPLHFAVNKGDREMVVRLLARRGATLTQLFQQEATDGLVGRAIMRKHLKIAGWLLDAGARLTVPPGLTGIFDRNYSDTERIAALEMLKAHPSVTVADMVTAADTGPGGVLGQAVMAAEQTTIDWMLTELNLDGTDHAHVLPALGLGLSRGVDVATLAAMADQLGLRAAFSASVVGRTTPQAMKLTSALLDLGRPAASRLAGAFDLEAVERHAAAAGAAPDAKNQHALPATTLSSPPLPHEVSAWTTEAMALVLRARGYIQSKQRARGGHSKGKKSRVRAWSRTLDQLMRDTISPYPDATGQLDEVYRLAWRTLQDLKAIGG